MPQHLVSAVLFDGTLSLEWEECKKAPDDTSVTLENLLFKTHKQKSIESPLQWMLFLGLSKPSIPLSPSLAFWREFGAAWLHQVQSDPDLDKKREEISPALDDDDAELFVERLPEMIGSELVNTAYLSTVWNMLTQSFASKISTFKGSVDEFFKSVAPGEVHKDRIHFHLVENRKNPDRPFAFLATYSTRIDASGRTHHQPLKLAFKEYADNNSRIVELLSTVVKVSRKNSLIESLVYTGEIFRAVGLTVQEAYTFLEGVADFEASGILCRVPRWWKGSAKKVAVSLSLGNKKPSNVGFESLLHFDASLHLDGETIKESEAEALLERAEELVLIKGRWVPVDLKSISFTLERLRQAKMLAETESVSFSDAIKLLMGSSVGGKIAALGDVEVSCGAWLQSVFQKMTDPSLIRETTPSKELKAHLRHYQQQGLNWLSFMQTLGFGVLLADDMGLGKTVQILAHLQKLKKRGRTSLIVAPASLLENWRTEIQKFTPDLKASVLHPQMMSSQDIKNAHSNVDTFDLVITSYGLLRRYGWLKSHSWFYAICDEAQTIKNPATGQTKDVKELKCLHRCAITGTPVENRLTDLWSVFDFVNPGLLGTFQEFKRFAKNLQDNPGGFGRLRKVIRPYILRRSKTDKTIISDLPDKIELKTWCSLSKNQTILYEKLVERLDEELGTVDGMERRGLILGYLSKFKQLCNHIDHYSGNGRYDPKESGKFERLAELCGTIHDKREKVLVFTQFAEIIEPLSSCLEKIFGVPGLKLSGSTTVRKRKEAVKRFQSSEYVPFFILSIKAGGVGLNLTAANHVIHFDRWWNPAVENQATDRAFRIGQKKNVMVHKLICKGTIEEKIDLMIDEKRSLASEITTASSENWITELNDREIREMFRFGLNG
ncbi:MAG: DEAD/DEAH box helicase [Chitinispirillaceae bacterium]